MSVVFDQAYPPNTVEFSGIIRALNATKPDIVYVASYPPDSAGILRAVNEIGIADNVKIFGGGMVGLQFAAVMENLGSLLNGVVNYNTWLPEPSMYFDGTKAFFDDLHEACRGSQGRSARLLSGAVRLRHGSTRRAGHQGDGVARPEGHRKIPARERDQDHRRSDRVFGGRRAQGNRDADGAVPRRRGQEHRAVPQVRANR